MEGERRGKQKGTGRARDEAEAGVEAEAADLALGGRRRRHGERGNAAWHVVLEAARI